MLESGTIIKSQKKKKKTETVQTNSEQSLDEGSIERDDDKSVNIAQEDKTFQGNTECASDFNSGM